MTESQTTIAICRTCLSEAANFSIFNIKKKVNDELFTISDMIAFLTRLEFTLEDGLPQHICLNCIYQVDQAFCFRQKCIEVDGQLRQNKLIADSQEHQESFNCASASDIEDDCIETREDEDPLHDNDEEILSEDDNNNGEEEEEEDEEEIKQEVNWADREPEELVEEETVIMDPSQQQQQIQIMIQGYPHTINGLQQIKTQILPAGTVVAPVQVNPKPTDITINYDFIKKENMGLAYSSPNSLLSYTTNIQNDQQQQQQQQEQQQLMDTKIFTSSPSSAHQTHECEYCGKKLVTKTSLKNHVRTHTGEKPYECEICYKKFTTNSALEYHLGTHAAEKPFNCTMCKKKLVSKVSLEYHMRTHSGEKPYKCDICDKPLTTKGALEYHSRTHTGEKPYKCDICGKYLASKPGLDYHVKAHTSGETLKSKKSRKCEICGKVLTTKQGFEYHVKAHANGGALRNKRCHECHICGKILTTKPGLEYHMKIHIDEKPYKCITCNISFVQQQTLDMHNQMTHGHGK